MSGFLKKKNKDTGIRDRVLKEIWELAQQYKIHKVILFGSRARGDYHKTSDIDLAVSGEMCIRDRALAMCWSTFDRFLRACPRVAASISATGFLVAAAAVTVRPSSLATFAERLEMMRNGMGYLAENPLLGVGPYQWRLLNLADGDKYFNTWHIHNVLIHVGVEMCIRDR